jgi:hypothetical protein
MPPDMSGLNHPKIVKVTQFFKSLNVVGCVQKYFQGENVKHNILISVDSGSRAQLHKYPHVSIKQNVTVVMHLLLPVGRLGMVPAQFEWIHFAHLTISSIPNK